MFSPPSSDDDVRLLDHVAHEPTWIPIGRVGLYLATGAGAPYHQHLGTRSRWREGDRPLAETVLAFVPAELCLVPGVAAVVGEIDPRDACIAAKSYSARQRRGTGLQGVASLDVGDEGTRNHTADRHQSK